MSARQYQASFQRLLSLPEVFTLQNICGIFQMNDKTASVYSRRGLSFAH